MCWSRRGSFRCSTHTKPAAEPSQATRTRIDPPGPDQSKEATGEPNATDRGARVRRPLICGEPGGNRYPLTRFDTTHPTTFGPVEAGVLRFLQLLRRDRKSTRLNSSH